MEAAWPSRPQLTHPQWGWAAPYASGTIVAALCLLVVSLSPSAPRPPLDTSASILAAVTDRSLLPFAAMQASTFGLSIVVGNWVVPLLLRYGDSRSAAWVGSLTLLAAVIGRPVGGWLTARHPHWTRRLVASSFLLGATGLLLVTIAEPMPVALAGSLLVGFCTGVPFGPIYNSATALGPPGLKVSAITMPALLFILFGTPLVGWTFQLPGDGRIGFIALAVMLGATALALPRSWRVSPARET